MLDFPYCLCYRLSFLVLYWSAFKWFYCFYDALDHFQLPKSLLGTLVELEWSEERAIEKRISNFLHFYVLVLYCLFKKLTSGLLGILLVCTFWVLTMRHGNIELQGTPKIILSNPLHSAGNSQLHPFHSPSDPCSVPRKKPKSSRIIRPIWRGGKLLLYSTVVIIITLANPFCPLSHDLPKFLSHRIR